MNARTIHIDSVQPHPENPRVHDLEAIAGSLRRFGQTKPIIVQESTGYVVAGNGTRLAAKQLGWDEVTALFVDMTDEAAKAYMAADNRTSDQARYDSERLLELLTGLEDLDGTGFDPDYVDALEDSLGANVIGDTNTGEVRKVAAPVVPQHSPDRPPKSPTEPMRDIVMLMTVSRAAAFGEKVVRLQKAWGTRTVVDTVERAVDEASAKIGGQP